MDSLDIIIILLSIAIAFLLIIACYNDEIIKAQQKKIKKLTSIRPLYFEDNIPMRLYNPQEEDESLNGMNNIIE